MHACVTTAVYEIEYLDEQLPDNALQTSRVSEWYNNNWNMY